jgi:maltokinase
VSGSTLELTVERRQALTQLMSTWDAQRGPAAGSASAGPGSLAAGSTPTRPHPGAESADEWIEVHDAELLVEGRPAVLDVIADVRGHLSHAVLGVKRPGSEAHLMRTGDDPVIGLFEDDHGLGVVIDALRDAELAPLVMAAVTGEEVDVREGVASVSDDAESVVLAFGDRQLFTVFPRLFEGPHPGVAMLVALDEAGFNHLAAPLALWRRSGRDLGFVQERLAGSADGWSLALTSLRDLYASGGEPEQAGGDFAFEARALGTMTARMHLGLDKAFGRQSGDVAAWVDRAAGAVARAGPSLLGAEGVNEALQTLRSADLRPATIRSHGDFHLGRTARTDQGWVVVDWMPAGLEADSGVPEFRSPLADVADLLWSLHHIATVAAAERDPTGRSGLNELARAWEARNRRAFLSGYLATPGIGGLLPADRDTVRNLAAVFELERAAELALRAEGRPEPDTGRT